MKEQHPARDLAQMAARIDAVGDVSDALGSQTGTTDFQDPISDDWWHPRVETVGNDVIELAQISGQGHQVKLPQVEISELQSLDHRCAPGYRLRSAINAQELTPRQVVSHRQQVGPVATRQLEYPAVLHRYWCHSKYRRQARQTISVSLGIGIVWVEKLVVGIDLSSGHGILRR